MFKNDKPLFEKTARKWVLDYAMSAEQKKEKIKMMMEMGFPQDTCKKAL